MNPLTTADDGLIKVAAAYPLQLKRPFMQPQSANKEKRQHEADQATAGKTFENPDVTKSRAVMRP